MGSTSTVVQILTTLALGSFDNYRWGWSTGGAVALVAGIYMLVKKHDSWAIWWRRMWPWLLLTSVLAFGVMVAAYQPSSSSEGLPDKPSFGLASEWAVVDEASHQVTVETDEYDVFMTEISPCCIGQDWGACISSYIAEFKYACTERNLSLTGLNICRNYEDTIVEMQSRGESGSTVSSLGGNGTLAVSPHTLSQTLPAVTHVAVCYLGLFGECS